MKKVLYGTLFLAVLTFAALAPQVLAAAPDAGVKGLWIASPNFPADAELIAFKDNTETETVEYVRMLSDGSGVTFSLVRQLIEGSEFQRPEDVRDMIETLVNNDDGDMDAIEVEVNPEALAEHLSYPCAVASYRTGQNESTRRNVGIFIFTDKYFFAVEADAPIDMYEDYEDRIVEWMTAVALMENEKQPVKGVLKGRWVDQKFPDGAVESETMATTVYQEPSYSSKPLRKLADETPVFLDAVRRYETDESPFADLWWHITKPIEGWVASEDVYLWYSGFLSGD
jgi:hypothetical protein